MKVILLNRYGFPDESATSRMVWSLAAALRREGYEAVVVASRLWHDNRGATLPTRETIAGVAVHRLGTTRFGRSGLAGRALDYLSFHLAAMVWLLANLRPGDVCVVCTDPPLLSVSALGPVALRRGILVNWIMDLFPETATLLGVVGGRGPATRALTGLRDLSFRAARCNVAPIPRMASYLRGRGLPAASVETIEHWSDGTAIVPMAPGTGGLRAEWGLQDRFVVGYSGNLGRAHEFGTILAAARELREERDIVFLFVGDGHQRAWVEQEAGRLGLANVQFRPLQPRERLSETLAVADVHLVTLRPELEPCIVPSKFYGIAAAGRPTLFVGATDGEIASLVHAGACGAAVAIGGHGPLAGHVRRLFDDPGLCRLWGENARRLFDDRFGEARGVADWVRLLQRLPAASGTPLAAADIMGGATRDATP